MQRLLNTAQKGSLAIGYRIVSNAIAEGKNYGTIVRNSAGNYTITFNRNAGINTNAIAFARLPICIATPVGASNARQATIVAQTASTVNVVIADNAGVATDSDFNLIVIGFDSADEG